MKKITLTEEIKKIKRLYNFKKGDTMLSEQDTPEATVGAIQQFLIDVGVLPKLNEKGESNVDGIPGESTAKAVGEFLMGVNNDIRTVEDLRKKLEIFNGIIDGVPHPGVKKGWGVLMSKAVSTAIEIKQKGGSFFVENKDKFEEYLNDSENQKIILSIINQQLPGNKNKNGKINSSEEIHNKDHSIPVGIHDCDDCIVCGYATFYKNPCDFGFLNYKTSGTLNQLYFHSIKMDSMVSTIGLRGDFYIKSPWRIYEGIDISTKANMDYTTKEDEENYYLNLKLTHMEQTTTTWESVGVGYIRIYNNKIQYKNKTINKWIKGINNSFKNWGISFRMPELILTSGWKDIRNRISGYVSDIELKINKKEIAGMATSTPYNPNKKEKSDLKKNIIKTTTKNTKISGTPPAKKDNNVFRTLYNPQNTDPTKQKISG